MLSRTVTKPAAGVIATRPTTAPMQAPRADGFVPRIQSKNIQPSIAAAEAVLVVAKAIAAVPLAAERRAGVEAEPAEPEHAGAEQDERDVGRDVRSRLARWILRRPRTIAPARAAKPGRHVDDRAAGEVHHAPLVEEAVGVPGPVGQRAVDEAG